MDELIRELSELAVQHWAQREDCETEGDETAWHCNDSAAQAYEKAITLAQNAKRRMAEREPTWILEP